MRVGKRPARRPRPPVRRTPRPHTFEQLESRRVLDSTVVFNEIQFNPTGVAETLEWIELYNQLAVDVDLSRWRIDGAGYTFPGGTVLGGGDYLVVARSPADLQAATGFANALGPYAGSLDNNGERLDLVNLNGRVMDTLQYGVDGRWPVGPDGSGSTLAKRFRDAASDVPENWTTSAAVFGTPGTVNFPDDTLGPGPTDVTLVGPDASARLHVPTVDDAGLGAAWTAPDYDDAAWSGGTLGVGFDADVDTTTQPSLFNVALGKPVILSTGSYAGIAGFEAQNVTDGSVSDVFSNGSINSATYWLGRESNTFEGLIIDLGAPYLVQELRIRNTHNTQYNDRGTGSFRITVADTVNASNQLISPVQILSKILPAATGQDPIAPNIYTAATGLTVRTFRYLRLDTSTSVYTTRNVGINEIEAYALGIPPKPNLALGRPAIDSSGSYAGLAGFEPQNVTDGSTGDVSSSGAALSSTYWLGPEGAADQYFTLDLGAPARIDEIRLRNTHNATSNDRGTADFEIFVSNQIDASRHLLNPVRVLGGTLAAATGQDPIATQTFTGAESLTSSRARYVQFHAISSNYGNGNVGLNEIELYGLGAAAPQAYWSFDGTLDDLAGAHNGVAGATTFVSDAPAALGGGQSLAFDGGTNRYVSAQLDVSETAYSVSLWFKTAVADTGIYAVVDPDLGSNGNDRHLYLSGGNIAARTWNNEVIVSTGHNFADNQWHHLVHVYGLQTGGERIDVDGAVVASGSKSNSDFNWQTHVNIGFSNDSLNHPYFDGQLDDVSIWATELTAAQITALGAGLSPLLVSGYLSQIGTDVQADVQDINASLWMRIPFDVGSGQTFDQLTLRTQFDDGFAAYLNGTLVAGVNAPATLEWNSAATAENPDQAAVAGQTFDLTAHLALLTPGQNVLAIHALNRSAGDSDFLISPRLVAHPAPVVVVGLGLAINEAASAADAEFWLELVNTGGSPVELGGLVVSSTASGVVDYVLPAGQLAPGEYRVLTELDHGSGGLGFGAVAGDRVFLFNPGKTALVDALLVGDRLRGRAPDGTGKWLYPTSATPGGANDFAFHDEIVINEIMYHHRPTYASPSSVPPVAFAESTEEWIELYNRGNHAVDLTGWRFDGDLDYGLPAGFLGAGAYLVVANDAAALAAKYPGIAVVGNFTGNLPNVSGRIVLKDGAGNPADEVTYYQDDPWPAAADGGGASLELRNPFADNSRPEAWQASNELPRSTWQHYEYTGVAVAPVYDPTTNSPPASDWHEFLLSLLDSGEVLLDNISVIESPATTNLQVLQNGTFTGDTVGNKPAAWRIQGTHEPSDVDVDPDNPANHVLHLVANGRPDYMSNHAETTFVGNRAIFNGTTYKISYDARWISGSPQLHTELYYTRVPRTTIIVQPVLGGTPGTQNSVYVANLAPTFADLHQSPAVPPANEPATITVRADDPDGVSDVALWYSVAGGAWTSAAMSGVGNQFSAEIPGQTAGTVVQFYVTATDGLGAAANYPAAGPNARALAKWDDGRAQVGVRHNFRMIVTAADQNKLFAPVEMMSNQRLGGTVVYDEREVFYDVGIRLRGSMFSRANINGTGYSVAFPADHLFRGVHESVTLKTPGKAEILVKHTENQLGLPGMYDDLVYMNTPHGGGDGVAIFSMARFGDEFIDSQFDNGGDGTVFKMQGIRVLQRAGGAGPEDLKTFYPNIGWIPAYDLANLGNDAERYRWSIPIGNNRSKDDFSRIVAMDQALSLTGTALQTAVNNVLDVDEWLRLFALQSLWGIGDAYMQGNPHNVDFYVRPSDNKVLAMPWDWNFVASYPTNSALYNIEPGKNFAKVIALPAFGRVYYGHMLDMINTYYNAAYISTWASAYGQLAGESYAGYADYAQQRGAYVLSQLPASKTFQITSPVGNAYSTTQPSVVIAGDGWINVRTIDLVGQGQLPVTWTSINTWRITVPLVNGANPLTFEARDFQGTLVGTDSITVTTSAANPSVLGQLRITELMYHPADPPPGSPYNNGDFEFVEVANIGTVDLPLAGTSLSGGVQFAFPSQSLAAGEHAVIVANQPAFVSRYGAGVHVLGTYTGHLGNGGDDLLLSGPLGEDVLNFSYLDTWYPTTDGGGPSLAIVSELAARDTWGLPASWRASTGGSGSPGAVDPDISPNPTVINTLDSGPGSLRQALLDVAATAGQPHAITCAIPGAGPHAIALASALPAIAENVTLLVNAGDEVNIGGAGAFGFPDFAALVKTGGGTLVWGGGDVRVSGAALTIDAGLLRLHDAGAGLLAVQSLAVSPGAKLDLSDSDLVVHATAATRAAVLAQITALVANGAANLTWTGPGISSSAAAGDPNLLTALGVMLNDNGLGGAYYPTFSGEPVDANSVLVKYTYYGDADLSGIVDGTDYALTDNGFNAVLTGWFNGDFDYTNMVDGTDYALIDNAFNAQGAPLSAFGPVPRAAGGPGAVVEQRDGGPTNSIPLVGRAGEGGDVASGSTFDRAAFDRALGGWDADAIGADWLDVLSGGGSRRRKAAP